MKKSHRIASDFLRNVRNAFAHNYIQYDEDLDLLKINLESKNHEEDILSGEISLAQLNEIVDLIKQTKNQ